MPKVAEAKATVVAPATPIFSKVPPKASAVAGPPVSATEPVRMPRRGSTPSAVRERDPQKILQHGAEAGDGQEPEEARASAAHQFQAGAQADGGHERDHQQIAQHHVGIDVDEAIAADAARRGRRPCRPRSRRGY